MRQETKKALGALLGGIIIGLGMISAYYCLWSVGKLISYRLIYEDHVKETVRSMVTPGSLK